MTGYRHPSLKHLVLYDLPGAGTIGHPSHTYFCDKRLYVFDCLLLVTSERIRENDLAIAKLAQEMGTPVVFVRNKTMNDLKTMRDNPEYMNMGEKELIDLTISIIKENIYKTLKAAKIENSEVFVIEAHSLREFSKINVDGLYQLENIIKFEEIALFQHLTKLASVRSDFSYTDMLVNEAQKQYQKFFSKNKKVQEPQVNNGAYSNSYCKDQHFHNSDATTMGHSKNHDNGGSCTHSGYHFHNCSQPGYLHKAAESVLPEGSSFQSNSRSNLNSHEYKKGNSSK